MRHIYCFSGLGADHRLFQNLEIKDAEMHAIHWEIPSAQDTMATYALKLAKQIKHNRVVLLGVSFGGMLVTEVAAHLHQLEHTIDVEKVIVVSSCKSHYELPFVMRMAGKIRLHKLAPYQFILRNNKLNRIAFSMQSQEEELYLKRQMLENSSIEYIKISINIILSWKAGKVPDNIIHIHGNKDRLLRPGSVKADYWIENAGHFMVWNKASEISKIINDLFKDSPKN
jgi:pimeloyl-ACP methyl ester carboxylesterase